MKLDNIPQWVSEAIITYAFIALGLCFGGLFVFWARSRQEKGDGHILALGTIAIFVASLLWLPVLVIIVIAAAASFLLSCCNFGCSAGKVSCGLDCSKLWRRREKPAAESEHELEAGLGRSQDGVKTQGK